MTKVTKGNQGEGIAVFKLIGYFRNQKQADKHIEGLSELDEKYGTRYRIYKTEKMMLWGTEYDKPTKGNSG